MDNGGRIVERPHHAQICFNINIFPMSQDGSLIPKKLSNNELEQFGIKDKAIFNITGYNKEDCIKKLKEVLESLKYEE
jgi:hypothetical protein